MDVFCSASPMEGALHMPRLPTTHKLEEGQEHTTKSTGSSCGARCVSTPPRSDPAELATADTSSSGDDLAEFTKMVRRPGPGPSPSVSP